MCDLLRALKANGVNCANIKNDGIRMVREEGDCIFNAQSVTVDLFTNTDLGNQITKALASLAGGYRLHPDNNWSLNTQDEATALKLSKLLNIKIS